MLCTVCCLLLALHSHMYYRRLPSLKSRAVFGQWTVNSCFLDAAFCFRVSLFFAVNDLSPAFIQDVVLYSQIMHRVWVYLEVMGLCPAGPQPFHHLVCHCQSTSWTDCNWIFLIPVDLKLVYNLRWLTFSVFLYFFMFLSD